MMRVDSTCGISGINTAVVDARLVLEYSKYFVYANMLTRLTETLRR
jgi:hypothetical protein